MTTATSIEDAIAAANATFVERMNAGDITGACEVYTEDARILPPGGEIVQGKGQIAEFWSAALPALGVTSVSLETVVLEPIGEDSAREIGRFRLEGEDGLLDHGKFVVIWKQSTDGGWNWDWDIWNSSQS
ncbi:MAG: DUF4440 domain-containing protein [Gemmatimonadetes bacterium]|nr:DUF4440 domain-containing protein [Gemmatimonadota bacterium]